MKPFEEIASRYFPALFLVAFVWVVANFAWRFFRHRQNGISFPPLTSVRVLFHEGTASGNSDKTFFSRIGGARNCLRVTVTDTEVWIRGIFPFYLVTESDLEHRISRAAIIATQLTESAFGRRVLLDFRCEDGKARRLALLLKNPEAFLAALKVPPPVP